MNVASKKDVWDFLKGLMKIESDDHYYAKFSFRAGKGGKFILDDETKELEVCEGDEIAVALCRRFGIFPENVHNVHYVEVELSGQREVPLFKLEVFPIN